MSLDLSRYDPVWRAAEPYMRARKNDVHIPLSFDWCVRLLEHFPQADRDVCLLAILLHDIGWWAIDMETIISEGFRSENILQSDVRYRHEAEGVRLGTEVLRATGWSEDIIAQVCEIIDGHDTRPEPRHLNDRIVRDSDKLWRYEVTGTAVGCDWFGETPAENCRRNEKILPKFETEPGRAMATAALAETRKALKVHVL
ncbi:HD domain-containing protein [Tabrizicola oligotrophica]|uniref:HD domain-containing protein n=1 Tax=Tabrizicola oligotrophica TaxID=2710650 RepID=A0A6M0QRU7_9RHOB|nr:HD domain-containing protein [Tabrizicola oligotrophica]NEY90136.1 HD domain-containing protein [Tabrizicola oligotrophica]